MKVAIYMRVSMNDQTIENQKQPLINYCERMGYNYTLFEETESTRKSRPIQYELYNRLLRKEFDGLIIYKFDRWARSTSELVEHMNRLHEKGILIYSYTDNIDLNTSMGKAMLTIISAFAQLERDIIRERTVAGLRRVVAQGKKLGRPFKDGSLNHINYVNPNEDEVLRLYYKENKTFRDIGNILGTSKSRVAKMVKQTPPEKIKQFLE